MTTPRVTSSQLFELADSVCKLAGEANQTIQQGVVESLNSALVDILNAAKSAAFNEARTAYNADMSSKKKP